MLARRRIPSTFHRWNRRWGAPSGYRWFVHSPFKEGIRRYIPSLVGPFAFQINNTTRRFEYPWAYLATPLAPGMRALEIGGSLSGFQFVLARSGLRVVNVDPGEQAQGVGWPVATRSIERLNRAFGTNVELKSCFLEDADLPRQSFDRVFALSTLEHIPPEDVGRLLRVVRDLLTQDGLLVATVDLFLDLAPFSTRRRNRYGWNLDLRRAIEESGLTLAQGRPEELLGHDAFEPDHVMRNLGEFLIGANYPTLVQTLVLRRS